MATPLDGNPTAGEPAQPTPATSQEPGQLSKEDVLALVQRLDAAEKQLKGLQKGTDKQIGQVRDDVKRILELNAKGLDEGAIHRELLIDRVLADQSAPIAPADGKQLPSEPSFDVETVVKAMDFPENDVAVAALKKAYEGKPSQLIAELAKLKVTQASTKPAGPAGALPPSGGLSAGGEKSVEALTTEYQTKMLAAPRGRAGDAQRTALKEEYRKKGVNIDAVTFA